jgi:hypothetical protein
VDDRTSRLESAVERLEATVASLRQRLDALEAKGLAAAGSAAEAVAQSPVQAAPADASARPRVRDQYDPITILSLIGRLLVVLAGGFFLRAMTDAGTLPVPVGIGLAFAYAAVWLAMSDVAGRRGKVPNALLHAMAAALVAFPLVVEATLRFKVLGGLSSAGVVTLLSAALLFVAWRRRLRGVAWIAVVGALPASAILLVQTGVVAPFALFLVALGVATLWLGYSVDWWGNRWPAALAADIIVASVTLRAFAPEQRDTPLLAMLLLVLLIIGYFVSFAVRTLDRGRDVGRFEVVQTIAVLVVGLWGAVSAAQGAGAVAAAIGVAALLAGAACYAVAIAVVGKREGSTLNFYFYTTLALVLVLAGFTLATSGAWLGAALGLLGVLAIALWSRSGRLFLLLHGAAYIVAAGIASGALVYGLRTLVAGAEGPWTVPDVGMLVVLVASALCAGLAAVRPSAEGDDVAIGTRFVITIVFVWLASGSMIGFVAPATRGLADGSVDPGGLATVSTAVLSVATLALAWIGRRDRFREWGWLVYPLLVGIGIKLLTQDFKHSRPATLFIALALYGAALIIAPRLRRRVEKLTA